MEDLLRSAVFPQVSLLNHRGFIRMSF